MDASTLELVELDQALDFEPRCESIHHEEGIQGHSGHAAYLQLVLGADCPASVGFRCAGYVELTRQIGRSRCSICHIAHELRWIPIQQRRSSTKDVNA